MPATTNTPSSTLLSRPNCWRLHDCATIRGRTLRPPSTPFDPLRPPSTAPPLQAENYVQYTPQQDCELTLSIEISSPSL